MAVAVTRVVKPIPVGDRWMTVSTVAFDNSYPTNGEPLTRADLGFSSASDPEFAVLPTHSVGYALEYDGTNQKMKAFYGDNNNASDGPLIEVPNTTDLTAITAAVVVAFGKYRG